MLIVVGILVLLIVITVFVFRKKEDEEEAIPTVDEQFGALNYYGINLKEDQTLQELIEIGGGTSKFEEHPWSFLLSQLGSFKMVDEEQVFFSDNCYTIRKEEFKVNGYYKILIKNFSRISNKEIICTNVKEELGSDNSKVKVSFIYKKEVFNWKLKLSDSKIDPKFYDQFQDLARNHNTKGQFTYCPVNENDFVVSYLSSNKFNEMEKLKGLDLKWLSGDIFK